MGAQGPRAVVVADDDAALTLLCRVNLELEGYRVVEAHSRAGVARCIERDDVGVVLLDINLGADNGIEIARDIRARHPEIGLVFLTGSAPTLDAEHRRLVDAVLSKPFELAALAQTVRRAYRSAAAA